jgi:magnesium transporter
MGKQRATRRNREARLSKAGLPPGVPVYTGEIREGAADIQVMDYDQARCDERTGMSQAEAIRWRDAKNPTWIDVEGIHRVELVQQICETFGVHPLAMEDAVSIGTRPKIDIYANHVFCAVKMPRLTKTEEGWPHVVFEHMAIVLGPQWILTFQEGQEGDCLEIVRKRIRTGLGRIRQMGVDYLFHALIDATVDQYFVMIEQIESRIDEIESSSLDGNDQIEASQIYWLRAELLALRRLIWPLRDAISAVLRGETPLVRGDTLPYFRDLYDHVAQVIDGIDSDRERLVGAVELQLAVSSHKMNDNVRLLTLVSSIFIPLTFIAGIYGMNFAWMPPKDEWWGFPASMLTMGSIAVGMMVWFRIKGWF